MNRSEVIKIIVKELGIHESDSQEFMEILLAKVSSKITKGDKLVIDNIGSFEFTSDSQTFGLAASEADKLDFTPAINLGFGLGSVQFEVPSLVYDEHSVIDAFFSLSIAKPVINLAATSENVKNEYYQTFDKRNTFEQIVNHLLFSANLIQNDYYKTETFPNISLEVEPTGKLSSIKHSEFEEVRTSKIDDLGIKLQWKKELDEESILDIDLTNEKLEVIETKEDLLNGWDIGKLTPQPDLHTEPIAINSEEDFRRVTSATQELSVDLSELSSELSATEDEVPKVEAKEESESDSFFDFDSLLRESLVESVLNAEPIEEQISEPKEEEDNALKIDQKFIDLKERSEKLSKLPRFLDVRRWKKTEQYVDPFADEGTAGPAVVQKRNKVWYALSFLIALSMFSLVYWKLYGIPLWVMDTKTKVENIIPKKISPRIIERDYRIPLSYPYDKRNIASTSLIPKLAQQNVVLPDKDEGSNQKNNSSITKEDAKNAAKDDKKETPKVEKKEPPKVEKKESTVEKKNQTDGNKSVEKKSTTPVVQKDNSKNVKDNIFIENGKYVVQISSWKNKTKAEQEVARYLKKGFQTFLTQAEIPGKGIWYRVRVGYFNSMEEAESAASKIF